jgi:predicted ATPase with chaperone activity
MRHGAMPVHLLLVGPPSAGKSYTLQTVLRLLPPEAYHVIDAGGSLTVILG